MRIGLVQMTSSDDVSENSASVCNFIQKAYEQGAELVVTPEVTNCLSASRAHQSLVLETEERDEALAAVREKATALEIWVLAGSLALKSRGDDRFVNRSFLIAPDGKIAARYDKIHMFDVTISETEKYHESSGYRPGDRAVVADIGATKLGMTICYDVRFPALYRDLAQAGAEILAIPSAFSPATGAEHWEILLRARAIETGSYVLAPAQVGSHAASKGRQRQTWGHSMAIDPWGNVLVDAGTSPGVFMVDLDLSAVATARKRIPSLKHDRSYAKP